MAWALVEPIEDAVAAYVLANGATKLAAVEARYLDADTLDDFAVIRQHEPPPFPEAEYPALYIMSERLELEPVATGLANGFEGEARFEFALIVWGPDATTARRRGKRYAVALLEMLAEMIPSTGYDFGTGPKPAVEYLPLYTLDSGEYLADVRVTIGVDMTEGAL